MSAEQNVIESALASARYNIESSVKDMANLAKLQIALAGISELTDISTLYVWESSSLIEVNIGLKEEAKNSKLVHKLAQRFGIKFEKSPHWQKTSLVASGENDQWRFIINNYVPSSCALVTIEEELTPEEIQAAKDAVPTVRKSFKVVCAEPVQ